MSDLRCLKYEDALWGLEVNRAAQAVRVGSGRSLDVRPAGNASKALSYDIFL